MRTTLTLDDDVYEAVRTLAEATGRSFGELVSDLVRKGLRPRANLGSERGLPVFQVPRDARVIPGDRAARLLADEGVD
jgi:hypothetical protein